MAKVIGRSGCIERIEQDLAKANIYDLQASPAQLIEFKNAYHQRVADCMRQSERAVTTEAKDLELYITGLKVLIRSEETDSGVSHELAMFMN